VQALVAWAGQKEDAIRAAGVRDRQLTNFDLPRAIDPTMYVGLSFFDRQLKPQWLFSIHAASGMRGLPRSLAVGMSTPVISLSSARSGSRPASVSNGGWPMYWKLTSSAPLAAWPGRCRSARAQPWPRTTAPPRGRLSLGQVTRIPTQHPPELLLGEPASHRLP